MTSQLANGIAQRRLWERGVDRVVRFARRRPLAAAVVAGGLARLLSATVGFGFHAKDDYFHVVEPAVRWLHNPAFNWDASHLPGAGIRSHLVPRFVWLVLLGLKALHVTTPEVSLRVVYVLVGAYALLAVPGMYLLAGRLLDRKSALIATWLAAVYFAMPYAGTRLLIGAMAMPPLVFGLYFATFDSLPRLVAAGVLMGLACWFRYQVGVVALTVAVVLVWRWVRDGGWRFALPRLGAYAAGGLLAVAAQGAFDKATTGTFLGPVIANIQLNFHPDPHLTRSSPFVYVGLWLLLTVPPATIWLVPAMWRAAKRLGLVAWPFAVFTVAHSFVPHKEERFMLPVLPLFLLLFAASIPGVQSLTGRFGELARRWWPATTKYLLVVGGVLLLVATTTEPQLAQRRVLETLRHDPHVRGLVSLGPQMELVFFGHPGVPTYRLSGPSRAGFVEARTSILIQGGHANRFIAFAADRAAVTHLLRVAEYTCDTPQEFRGSWTDRLVYALNPRHNRRRSPILLWRCDQTAVSRRRPPQRDSHRELLGSVSVAHVVPGFLPHTL